MISAPAQAKLGVISAPAMAKAIVRGKAFRVVRLLEWRDGMTFSSMRLNESYDIRSLCQLDREKAAFGEFLSLLTPESPVTSAGWRAP
jgi:hypothetical protein